MSNLHYLYLFFLGFFAPVPGSVSQADINQSQQVVQAVQDSNVQPIQMCDEYPDCDILM
jgi:hypothetical protein